MQDQSLKCPRCDSPNTKFCYYNNYNLSQPRHFCKNCRRYWTKGGTLRNIPVGGGCRKHTKQRSAAASVISSRQQEQQHRSVVSSLGSGSVIVNQIQNPCSKPEPVLSTVGTGSGVPPEGSFTSLLGLGQFGNLFVGSGQSSSNEYLISGSEGNCWGNSNIGWTDLAMYTPSSKLQ